jgi:hypothetical protein
MRLDMVPLLAWLPGAISLGQAQGMGHWISEVTTQDGDSIVEPGETATVSLWMDLDPDVGDVLPDGLEVDAFAGGVIDIIGGMGAADGMVLSWNVNDSLNVGQLGTTDGINIFDVAVFQPFTLDIDASDPIFLMSFEWSPTEHAASEASFSPEISHDGMPFFQIYKGGGFAELWPATEHSVTIQVVPGPSGLVPMLALTPIIARR